MKKTHLPTHVTVSQRDVDTAAGQYLERSMALGEQVTTIGKCELIRYVGKINSKKLKEVEAAVLAQIDIASATVSAKVSASEGSKDPGNFGSFENFKKEERNSYGS